LVLIALALFSALIFLGCQNELYTGLAEEEANLILAALLSRDIEAKKVAVGKSGYSITVDSEDVIRSLELLKARGLPRPAFVNLGKVFTGQGMISTPLEERSRLSYALAEELSDTFSRLDGVVAARVHVVLAERDVSGAINTPASAAVVIRYLPDSPVVNLTAKIKEVSGKSIPDLSDDKVAVMLVPARPEVILAQKEDEHPYNIIFYPLAIILPAAAAIVILRLLGYKLAKKKEDGDS
jgi:type III secretion protein J